MDNRCSPEDDARMTFTPTPSPAQVRTGQDAPTLGTVLALLGLRPEQIMDGRFAGPATSTLADNLAYGFRADHTRAHILDMPIHDYGWCLQAGSGESYASCGGEALVYFLASPLARPAYIARDDSAGTTWDWKRREAGDAFRISEAGARPHPVYRFAQSG
jgi:hypothetical protein